MWGTACIILEYYYSATFKEPPIISIPLKARFSISGPKLETPLPVSSAGSVFL